MQNKILAIDPKLIDLLKNKIEECEQRNSRDNFEQAIHNSENEAEEDYQRMTAELRLVSACRNFSTKLESEPIQNGCAGEFRWFSTESMGSPEQLVMLCAGLAPLKVAKDHFNQRMTQKAFDELKISDENANSQFIRKAAIGNEYTIKIDFPGIINPIRNIPKLNCSGLMILDTNLGGKIHLIEVFNDNKKKNIQSRV